MALENDIHNLHATYCALTGRDEKARFYTATWGVILREPDYNYDVAAVERDMRIIVNYLLTSIRDGKRNAGALKLMNFLAPDKWFADLAEAKAKLKTRRETWREKLPVAPETAAKPSPSADAWEKGRAAFGAMQAALTTKSAESAKSADGGK